jgi:tetratricopeptide (TPR) repeat protein
LITRSIALSPQNPDALYNRANVFKSLDRIDDAIRDLELAIKINPRFVEALNNLGVLLSERGEKSKARFMWDRALSENPKHRSSLLNRGAMFLEMEQYLEAIADFKNIPLDKHKTPEAAKGIEGILDAYCLVGNWESFSQLFRKFSGLLWSENDPEFDECYVKSLFKSKSRLVPLRRRDRFRFLLKKLDEISSKQGRIAECGCVLAP